MTLTGLKQEAEQSITWRKHIMAEWIDSHSENRETSIMTCAVCGAWVQVNTNPMPNQISIGGPAVALECKESKPLAKGRSKAAKARKIGETVSYRVALIGIAWQGFTGTYDYSFDHAPTAQEIRARAGDFQSIVDYETVRVTRIQYTDGDRRIVKVVRPWQSPESIDTYCDANGC